MSYKLVISELGALRGYVSREFFHVMAELIGELGWLHAETVPMWESPHTLRTQLERRFGGLPEVILLWEGYEFVAARARQLADLDCRLCIRADDLHAFDERGREHKQVAFAACETIFTAYLDAFERMFPERARDRRVVWLPHAASPDFVVDLRPEPDRVIALSGAIHDYYPLRQRMLALHERGERGIRHFAHPGYHCRHEHGQDPGVGPRFAERLAGCLAGFTDASRLRYTVAKYFEIPATGALLLADDALAGSLERLGFVAGTHYVATRDRDLEASVRYVLHEGARDELDAIRERGRALVLARHTTHHRAAQIDRECTHSRDGS